VINTSQAYGIICDSQPSHGNEEKHIGFSRLKVRVCILYKLFEDASPFIYQAYSQMLSVT